LPTTLRPGGSLRSRDRRARPIAGLPVRLRFDGMGLVVGAMGYSSVAIVGGLDCVSIGRQGPFAWLKHAWMTPAAAEQAAADPHEPWFATFATVELIEAPARSDRGDRAE
jgi:hypothetical protein